MRNALLLVALAACTSEGSSPNTQACAFGDAEATIISSTVRAQFLQLEIEHGGGCEDHRYALQWPGFAGASNPPLIPLSLEHFGNGDTCEALITATVWFDLTPLHVLPIAPGSDMDLSISMLPLSRTHAQSYTVPAAQGAPPSDGAIMLETCPSEES
jgi:hypothetical protein